MGMSDEKGKEMKTLVVYIHGFNSSPSTEKSRFLSDRCEECNYDFVALSYGADQFNARAVFANFYDQLMQTDIEEREDVVFIGTSLGGFWASVLAQKYQAHAVLVNPSLNPLGSCFKNNKTAQNTYLYYNPCTISGAAVVLAKDDAILDYRVAKNALECRNKIVLCETGGHRFPDMTIPWKEAVRLINTPFIEIGAGE
jgi:predicted esterase YcpF (UPF0227 family)